MIELRLIHDGADWVAEGEGLAARSATLEGLDRLLEAALREDESRRGAGALQLRMTFDQRVIPEWMRQYANHYFNRVVTVEV